MSAESGRGVPSGTVTFLFTDIEGSTRLWEEHGEAMAMALARHDEIAKSAFEAYDGNVFATGGDGFAVAFGRVVDGLAAAQLFQDELGAEPWDGVVISVRMGLHVGEAEERGGDYFGPAVNKSARVMAAGHGGQILTTEAFAHVSDSDALVDLGECRLRDLAGPQRVFQVGERSFPRLRTLDAYPSNLPQNLSTFIGREAQVSQILEDLRARDLVTLTGTGGVGKTRLAVQACAEALPEFPGGAWFVDLATVRDPDRVAAATAAVLDVKERPGEALAITLRDQLRDREAIVLLDNGEHVVDALAGLIDQLRSREIATKFLITSREPLGVDGEQVRRVLSLDSQEGVELFVERASSVRSDIDWRAHQHDIADVCERLDGIPLAIELAAARSRSMLPADILARLDERFRLLSGGRRTARERHQTLLAAVEWSYDLLEEDERAVFDRLAVFRGGFSLGAAEAVCSGGGIDGVDVVDLLDRLVDKSMVLAYESGDRSRYRLLETLRQFAESRLADSGAADEFRDRHHRFYVRIVEELSGLLPTSRQVHALSELEAESSNIDAALTWLVDCDRWLDCWYMCRLFMPIWTPVAAPEGIRWIGLLVENLDRFDPPDQVHILSMAGNHYSAFDSIRGRELGERAIRSAERHDLSAHPGAYLSIALGLQKDGDDETALQFALRAEQDGDLIDGGAVLLAVAIRCSAAVESRHPDAEAYVADFTTFADRLGMPTAIAAAKSTEGRFVSLAGEYERADEILTDSIALSRDNSPQTLIAATAFRAEGRLRAGDERVLDGLQEALELFADAPVAVDAIADIWAIIATIWLRDGRVDDAAVLGCAAGALLMSLGVRGRANHAYIREQLGDDLAAALSAEELDAHIAAAREMTADDVRRFIFERL